MVFFKEYCNIVHNECKFIFIFVNRGRNLEKNIRTLNNSFKNKYYGIFPNMYRQLLQWRRFIKKTNNKISRRNLSEISVSISNIKPFL